jgi:AcrR family transcriptional regulator
MSPRRYDQSRRAEAADATRRRIVAATYELHGEKGISATTWRDIAARADVGLGTLFHHFRTYDDVIRACGAYTFEKHGVPTAAIFENAGTAAERLRRLVAALADFYRGFPQLDAIRGERSRFAALEEAFAGEEAGRRALIDRALLGTRATKRVRAALFALLDFRVYHDLVASGLSHAAAIDEITNLVLHRTANGESK